MKNDKKHLLWIFSCSSSTFNYYDLKGINYDSILKLLVIAYNNLENYSIVSSQIKNLFSGLSDQCAKEEKDLILIQIDEMVNKAFDAIDADEKITQ